jgi:hypothetical protein
MSKGERRRSKVEGPCAQHLQTNSYACKSCARCQQFWQPSSEYLWARDLEVRINAAFRLLPFAFRPSHGNCVALRSQRCHQFVSAWSGDLCRPPVQRPSASVQGSPRRGTCSRTVAGRFRPRSEQSLCNVSSSSKSQIRCTAGARSQTATGRVAPCGLVIGEHPVEPPATSMPFLFTSWAAERRWESGGGAGVEQPR